MNNRVKCGLVLAVLMFVSCSTGAVSAANVYNITDESYGSYFNASGYINNTNIHDGDVLDCYGTISNKNMYIDRPLNVTSSTKTAKICNGTINILKEGSGTNITDLTIENSNTDGMGIHLINSDNNTIKGNNIHCNGPLGMAIALDGSNFNQIIGNTARTSVRSDTARTHTTIALGNSNYNTIADNYVENDGANCIYLSAYGSGTFEGGLCYHNNITNNTCVGSNNEMCYAIQMMGDYNRAVNNTVKNAYRGVSASGSNDDMVGNTISGITGDCAVFAVSNSLVSGNRIFNSTSGISVSGSNVTVTNNSIYITGTDGDYGVDVIGDDNVISGNVVASNCTGIQVESYSNNIITGNNVTSVGRYAVDSSAATNSKITDNCLASLGGSKLGVDALSSSDGDVVSGNYAPVPVSAFTSTGGNSSLAVKFTDKSLYATSWNWNFGDGTSSSEQSPSHTYAKVGTYNVTLNVTGPGGSNSTSTSITVSDVVPPSVSASLTGGSYVGSRSVVLTVQDDLDSNPVIYYTLNGSTPTTGSARYTGPINMSKSAKLRFFALDASGNVSPVYTQSYLIYKSVRYSYTVKVPYKKAWHKVAYYKTYKKWYKSHGKKKYKLVRKLAYKKVYGWIYKSVKKYATKNVLT